MYSPKIRDEYIPLIYRIAKERNICMTTFVNEIIGSAIKGIGIAASEPAAPYQKRKEKKIDEIGRHGERTEKAETAEN